MYTVEISDRTESKFCQQVLAIESTLPMLPLANLRSKNTATDQN